MRMLRPPRALGFARVQVPPLSGRLLALVDAQIPEAILCGELERFRARTLVVLVSGLALINFASYGIARFLLPISAEAGRMVDMICAPLIGASGRAQGSVPLGPGGPQGVFGR